MSKQPSRPQSLPAPARASLDRGPGVKSGGRRAGGAPRGLTTAEAQVRLLRDGPNELPIAGGTPAWKQLAGQFVHFFALMLWVAGGLAFVARLPQLGVAIFLVVAFNAVFAFVQEYRAERAAAGLRALLPRRVTVVRDGARQTVDAAELVVGDLVLLEAGDRVPADLLTIEANAASLDTSALTGESAPSAVESESVLFTGTYLTEGEAAARVTATGSRTRLAGIARLSQAGTRPHPPLALELRRVVRTIARIAVAVGISFFLVALLLGTHPGDGFIFAVGVTVALVPEALLPTVTLSLAIGAQRMAERHALIRRLESVETLGSTTFICTDKTGTLTQNQMSVRQAWTPEGSVEIRGSGYEPTAEIVARGHGVTEALNDLARSAMLSSNGRALERDGRWEAQGDPMEAALDALARRVGIDVEVERARPVLKRFPFDPRRRRTSVVVGDRILLKGAPDAVLPLCRETAGAQASIDRMAERGLRVLAIAVRPLSGEALPASAREAEQGMELLGLVGLEDPPRPGAAGAVAGCRRAGIRLAMVTGDHPATARAIAREVGLAGKEDLVLMGSDLPKDEDAIGELLDRDGVVIGRVEPEEKLRIVKALRKRGHVVAVTGDGVNDGPALHEADIGVAMGRSGTDVAREAADLVLLDDDFATIVAAIVQGRAIFANVRRFLTYHLTDNVAEVTPFLVWALSGGRFPLALGVMQILALDIGTDTLSAVALGAEPAEAHALEQPPSRGRLLDRSVARRAFGLLGPVEAVMAMTAFVVSLVASGWLPGEPFPTGAALLAASGATFMTVVVAQTANAFACRSATRWPGALGWFSNRLLVVGASIELVFSAAFIAIPPVAEVLEHALPTPAGWAVAALSAPAVLVADAIQKKFAIKS